MSEVRNGYEINLKGKYYILLIDLNDDELIIKCNNKFSGDFFYSEKYDIEEIHRRSKFFKISDNIQQIQTILNKSIEEGKFGLLEDYDQITLLFYLKSDVGENTIAFSLFKERKIRINSKGKDSRKNNYWNNLEEKIQILEEKNHEIIQKLITINKEIEALTQENDEIKKESQILKEDNDLLRKENEQLKEYKNKYESITQKSLNFEQEFKDKINSDINDLKYNKDINIDTGINKEEEKLNIKELNNEEDNNMNIINSNNDYENMSEHEKEINQINSVEIKKNIMSEEKDNQNINISNNDKEIQISQDNNIKNEQKEIIQKENFENYDNTNNINVEENQKDEVNYNLDNKNYIKENEEENNKNIQIAENKSEIGKIEEKKEISQENNVNINNEDQENNEQNSEVFNVEVNTGFDLSKVKVETEYSEDEVEYIRNNEIINHKSQEEEIKDNININQVNNEDNIIDDEKKIKSNEEKEKEYNENINEKINENEENDAPNSNKTDINNNNIINTNDDVKIEKNINLTNEINLEINNKDLEKINLKEQNIADVNVLDKNDNNNNKNVGSAGHIKEEIKESINPIENINENKENDLDKNEVKKQNIEIKKEELNNEIQENPNDKNEYKEEIIKEQENDEDNKQMEQKEKSEQKIINNINMESYSNLKIKFKEDEETSNRYFYNDSINEGYKPSITPKKEINQNDKKQSPNISPYKELGNVYNINTSILKKNLKGNIIQNLSKINFITKEIHKNKYKINLNIIYKASLDGDKSSIFHEKCDKAQTTLIIIETTDNKIFGGYTKRTWRGNSNEKMDNAAFIFSLDKRKVYNVIKDKKVIGCFNEFCPYFIGAFKIFDNALIKGGILLRNEKNFDINDIEELIQNENCDKLTESDKDIPFDVKEIEVYEVKIA